MTSTDTKKRPRRMARERSTEVTALAESRETGPQTPRSSNAVVQSNGPTKTEKILNLLKREQGATLQELAEATSWLPHTTRAALTGLKKKGHIIARSKTDGVSRYSVTEAGS
ncbi:DUF3489 domain-containing protein [Tsuneonella sp. HG249]